MVFRPVSRLFLVLAATTLLGRPALAQFDVGDIVVLVERDIHIPAHPAPLDNSVPFRFVGGSIAEILDVESTSGWFQIRGERVGGAQDTGWITSRYINGLTSGSPPVDSSGMPAWCPEKGTQDAHPGGRLRVATWNLGNLHAVDGGSTFTGSDPSVKRFSNDYLRIRCYVRLFDPDILAVQEVDGEEALARVVDTDVYDLHVSSRPKSSFMGGEQNTGFAYKKGLNVQELADFVDLDVSNGDLRHGTRIDLTRGTLTLRLMSVHLKSGCFENSSSGSACTKLLAQADQLEAWIDEAAGDPDPFVVLGDFNRRFNLSGDDVWALLDDADPPNADLTAVTENMPISCRDNEFTSFIDHIVFDARAIDFADRSSFRHMTYRQEDRDVWDRISDHCPVMIELWLP